MLITASFKPNSLYETVHEIIRMAYKRAEIVIESYTCDNADVYISLSLSEHEGKWQMQGQISSFGETTNRIEEYQLTNVIGEEAAIKLLKKNIKVFCLQLLREHMQDSISNYGILTGVRPVKIIHRFMDKSYNNEEIVQLLKNEFQVSESKADLLVEVAHNNRRFIPHQESAVKKVSIYIGVPYCPSRCYYCSFPGAVLNSYEKEIDPFMDSLAKEMNAIGDYINEMNLEVQTIYLGGGTPTVLKTKDLETIFALLDKKFFLHKAQEITVEAGRPDTVTIEKLQLFKTMGVNRICINPQTMNDKTLALIGRRHNKKEVVQAVEAVREAGIDYLNMDLIIGLPDETIKEHIQTIEEVLELHPDNITIHTLALKRGSPMALKMQKNTQAEKAEEVEKSLDYIYSRLQDMQYVPYYLYRQKYMHSNMENIGYSLSDRFCIYNILMIEEKQTIIGMGGGAGSKFINPQEGTIQAFYNPKNPEAYGSSLERLIKRKVDNLISLN